VRCFEAIIVAIQKIQHRLRHTIKATGLGIRWCLVVAGLLYASVGCVPEEAPAVPTLRWYVFDEPSGAFAEVAQRCAQASDGAYRLEITPLPADADQQREQLVRRLAARDSDIDIIGMDVIWTAEFAEAGWILPWEEAVAGRATEGRIPATVESAIYKERLWAAPFTTNTQLLWYRTDRVKTPPKTWTEMINMAEALGESGMIQAQGERYEGLTVFFTSLLASAGGAVLGPKGGLSLQGAPTRKALQIMKRLAASPAAGPALSTAREDQARLGFETGKPSFMINYTFVWPSARKNAPELAAHMGWTRWPAVAEDRPSRVTIGGINLGIGAYSRYPDFAFQAAGCVASADSQRLTARRGGLPPTTEALYDDPVVRRTFPFADLLRATLKDAVQRAQTPVYNDISLAISRTLHPMKDIEPDSDVDALREAVRRALRSEGLL
jgi:multiple sugar transport system substrate-binding protein